MRAHPAAVDRTRSPPLEPCQTPPRSRRRRSGAPAAHSTWTHRRAPLDDTYIVGLVWRERRHLALAGAALLLCVAGNLASPVLSGALFEVLVKGEPIAK